MKKIFIIIPVIILNSGCTQKRYYWSEVPYCGGEAGGGFSQTLWVLTEHGNGGGIFSLHGMRPVRNIEFTDTMLVAVVACKTKDHSVNDLDKFHDDFSESKVPDVCPDQRIIVHPVIVEARADIKKSFAGSLPFPKIDPKELICKNNGVLKFGDGVHGE